MIYVCLKTFKNSDKRKGKTKSILQRYSTNIVLYILLGFLKSVYSHEITANYIYIYSTRMLYI